MLDTDDNNDDETRITQKNTVADARVKTMSAVR